MSWFWQSIHPFLAKWLSIIDGFLEVPTNNAIDYVYFYLMGLKAKLRP
jgi:hypothetical protein